MATQKRDLNYEEDVETATKIVRSIMGPRGRVLPVSKTVRQNVNLNTPAGGFYGNLSLWDGDIDVRADRGRLAQIRDRIGVELVIEAAQ